MRSTKMSKRTAWRLARSALLVSFLCSGIVAQANARGATDPKAAHSSEWPNLSYYLPMRDGVRLAVSVWFPPGVMPTTPVPVVLIQTRYGRAGVFVYGENGQYRRYLHAGFAVAVVDTRGTTSSFGPRVVEIGPQEAKDMDTLIQHFRGRPWSTGEVIATGVSYMADTADIAAGSAAGSCDAMYASTGRTCTGRFSSACEPSFAPGPTLSVAASPYAALIRASTLPSP